MDGFYEVMYDEEDEETYDHPDECWNCGDEWSPYFGFCQSCGERLFDESGELIDHESDIDEWGESLIETGIECDHVDIDYIDYAGIWKEMKKKVRDNYRRYGIHPLCKSCKTKSCKVPNVPGLNLICPRTPEYKEYEARMV